MSADAVRRRLAELIERVTDGAVPVETLGGAASLSDLGVDSLTLLRLMDAIEDEYGVEIDLARGRRHVDTVDGLTGQLLRQGVPSAGPTA